MGAEIEGQGLRPGSRGQQQRAAKFRRIFEDEKLDSGRQHAGCLQARGQADAFGHHMRHSGAALQQKRMQKGKIGQLERVIAAKA